jgi:hypothetical protein
VITIVPKVLVDDCDVVFSKKNDYDVVKELSRRGTSIEQVHKYKYKQ